MKVVLREALIILAIAAVMFVAIRLTIESAPVSGTSMLPTLQSSGERLLVNRLAYVFGTPQRGDIITLHSPDAPKGSRPYIKRIIGLPGETVAVQNGKVYINGQPLTEPYIMEPMTYTMSPEVVPKGYYFVLGDNRNISDDSHIWGMLAKDRIIGKAWVVIWPPSKWGWAPDYNFAKAAAGTGLTNIGSITASLFSQNQ